jgi:hypothetical protein
MQRAKCCNYRIFMTSPALIEPTAELIDAFIN